MLIFDAHLDLAWNAVEWNRNIELPIEELRKSEKHYVDWFPGEATVTFPEMTRGNIGICIATLLPRLHRKDKALTFFQSREAGYGASHGQLACYRALVAKGTLRELSDWKSIESHVRQWQEFIAVGRTGTTPPIGFILSMEGAPPILYPEQVHDWYAAGLRIVGPAHYGPNEYCHGTGCSGGLTADGRRLLEEMNKARMLLDATHLADESFWEALEIFQGPVLASHHNCRALVPADRQLSDDQIKALVQRGAVIGAAFDNWMLYPGWKKYVTCPSDVLLTRVVDQIDHVCQIAGNANHSGIGTDLDGGFGKEQSPGDLDTIADVAKLVGILESRGYSHGDIEKIMHGNFVDFFRRAWS